MSSGCKFLNYSTPIISVHWFKTDRYSLGFGNLCDTPPEIIFWFCK